MRDADRRGRAAVRAPRAEDGERDGAGGGHDGAAQLHLPQDVSQVRNWGHNTFTLFYNYKGHRAKIIGTE